MKNRVSIYQIQTTNTNKSVPYLFMDWDKACNSFKKSDYLKVADLLIEGEDDNEILYAINRLSNESEDTRFQSIRSLSTSDIIVIEGRAYYLNDRGSKRIPKSMWSNQKSSTQEKKFDWDRVSSKPTAPTKKLDVNKDELDLIKSILKGLTIKVEGNFKLDVSCTAIGLDLHAEYTDYKGSIEF